MQNAKLNICSLGDPKSPKTWSGTPYNLYNEISKLNKLGIAFDSAKTQPDFLKYVIKIISKIYYLFSKNTEKGKIERYFKAKTVAQTVHNCNTKYTLHTGTSDLPFTKLPVGQKHYLYCDSTWNLWSSFSTDMKGISKRLINDAERLEKESYAQMEHIFPISEYVKENLINHYGIDSTKITVVGTGLGVIQPYFGAKDYHNGKILFAAKGRFKDKGGFLVLEAFEKAQKINPDLKLIIVGQNDYNEEIKMKNVETYGFIPIEQLQEIFNETSLFLMPAFNEPWGLVYLEAMACKMPIVGINRNSFPELSGYGKYGFGIENTDADELKETIVRAFQNPEKLEIMGKEAQQFCVQNFSWNNTVSKIINTISITQ